MLKKSLIMLKKCTYNSQCITHNAQVDPIIMLIKTDTRHEETQLYYHRVQPFQVYMCLDSKVGTSWLINPLYTYQSIILCSPGVVTRSLLAIVCPKILKIMPVDAYNASIIIKCLYCSKLCRHNLPTPIYALLDL